MTPNPTPTDTPTPRTQLLADLIAAGSTGLDLSPGDTLCARAAEALEQLERELSKARKENERLDNLRVSAENYAADFRKELDALRARLTAAELDGQRLTAALMAARKSLYDCGEWYGEGPPSTEQDVAAIAAAMKEGKQ